MGANFKGIKISEAILQQCPELKDGFVVTVGVASGSKYPDGQSVADVAYWNENGTSTIPSRPFMEITAFKNADQWGSQLNYILKQSGYKVMPSLEAFGNMVVGQVKQEINDLWEPSLAASTILNRKRRHADATNKPLIDTGLLLNSFVYQIEKK